MKTKEIKYWINKYSTYIVTGLIALLLLKSCKSCSTEKRYEYSIKQNNELYCNKIDSMKLVADSLQTIINSKTVINKQLADSINTLKYENSLLKSAMDDAKKDKEYYRKQNRNLANMAEKHSVSPEHLSRTFKKETGFGFAEYLTLVRLQKAEYMLKKTVEKYAGKASEFARWLKYEIPEGLTVFSVAPDSVGVRRKLRTTK